MRNIVYSRTDVTGKDIQALLPVPEPNKEEWRDYRDIAVLAFPTPEGDNGKPLELTQVKGNGNFPWRELMEGTKKFVSFPAAKEGQPHWVEVKFKEPTTVRSVEFPAVQDVC